MQKSFGFTLAEILVTLGIIGVVAVLTIAALVKNYQKYVWVNQLKTTYNILEQGFQKMMADDGVDNLSDTTVFQSMNQSYCWSVNSNCTDFWDNFKQYIKTAEINRSSHTYGYLRNGSESSTYEGLFVKLQNGAFLFSPPNPMFKKQAEPGHYSCEQIKNAGGNMCDKQGVLYIDINGDKKPNMLGRDIYKFYLASNGHLYGWHGKDDCIFSKLNYDYSCLSPHCGTGSVGQGCAARIIQNGWKMDY